MLFRSGATTSAGLEAGLPGGTLHFYKLNAYHNRYIPITRDFVFRGNAEIGYGHGYDGKPLPFFRNYYLGGPGNLRGFYPGNVGPKDINNTPTGGSRKLLVNAELLFPFPGLPNDKSVRVATFADAGIIGESYTVGDVRTSVGFSVSYVSPFGPLKISFAQPIKSQIGDVKQKIQFQFGQQF